MSHKNAEIEAIVECIDRFGRVPSIPELLVINEQLERQNAELVEALEAIIETRKPLPNFAEYEVVAMSPTELINHVKKALTKSSEVA